MPTHSYFFRFYHSDIDQIGYLMLPEYKQLKYDNDEGQQEHEKRNTVDAMHVLHPPCMRGFRVSLFDVKILGQLSPDAHIINQLSTQNYNNNSEL